MIRHTVLFKAKPDTTPQEMNQIYMELGQLEDKLPGILSILCGECDFHEATRIQLFSHGFSIDFQNQYALDDFFHNPITHSVKGKIINAAAGGANGIIGFNFRA